MADWDRRFMQLAQHVGAWSKDRSTKVGCVIVSPLNDILVVGYNGFVRGADDAINHRHERPAKYDWTEHAERNAIYHAARSGIALKGSRMYLPWFPCMDCARAIVQSGIIELIAFAPDTKDERWGQQFSNSSLLFAEAEVRVRFLVPEEQPQNQ